MAQRAIVIAALLVFAGSWPCAAEVVISNAATQNMNCSNGLCVPTAPQSVLNVGDLETMLSSGDLVIDSSLGQGQHNPIDVTAPFTWSASTTLSLKGAATILQKRITVAGSGNLVLAQLKIKPGGAIGFDNLSSSLSIGTGRGQVNYTLVETLAGMASAIAANPRGDFALAQPYDASGDGTYTQSPVTTDFSGIFEGLGNTIAHISVNNTTACCVGGLFQNLVNATVSDLHLTHMNVVSQGSAGGLAYQNEDQTGIIARASVTGRVTGGGAGDIGGLVADNYGEIRYSYSGAAVSAPSNVTNVNVGGLTGVDAGITEYSFATGSVSAGDGGGYIGGLDGIVQWYVTNCYATGAVTGGNGLTIGGLVGWNAGTAVGRNWATGLADSYSTGAVSGGSASVVGGFIGENDGSYYLDYDYWDTTTSGTNNGVGSGSNANITGLTSAQLQSGLPDGFFSSFWHERHGINNGFPYLKFNPPPK